MSLSASFLYATLRRPALESKRQYTHAINSRARQRGCAVIPRMQRGRGVALQQLRQIEENPLEGKRYMCHEKVTIGGRGEWYGGWGGRKCMGFFKKRKAKRCTWNKRQGGGGIFKFGLRVSNTVCIGSRDSLAENLGCGVSVSAKSNIC